MRKQFDLSQRSIDILHKVMKDTGFKREVDAVTYLIETYERNEVVAKLVAKELEKTLTRIRLGTRTAEKNSMALMHLINTAFYKDFPDKDEFLMPAYGYTKHRLIKDAEDEVTKTIESAKQKKDSERSKKGLE